MTSDKEIHRAISHLRAARTKLAHARQRHGRLPASTEDLILLEVRELWKMEQRLRARAEALRALKKEDAEAKEAAA